VKSGAAGFRTQGPLHVFYSYSHEDELMLEALRKHLALLRRRGLITEWYDQDIEAGAQWREEIGRELEAADLILLLVSSDFLASDFCYEQEMRRAVERAERGEVKVIAVILRPVDGWESTPFAQFQAVPQDARPITLWTNADQAYSNVAAKVRAFAEVFVRANLPEELTPNEGDMRLGAEVQRGADVVEEPASVERAEELTAVLEDLLLQPRRADDNNFVIVQADEKRNYYAQFLGEPGTLWCEVVANEYLEPSDELTAEQMSRLVAFGWNPPQGEAILNWWYAPEEPSPRDVAWLTVQTLGKVYGVSLGQPFTIERSWA
jgi:hypothetical protein